MKAKHKLAIHELMSRAAYYFDLHDTDGLEACFCEDAKMLVNIAGGETFGPFDGRDSIMELMRGSLEAQKDRRRHIICDVFFESEGENEATDLSSHHSLSVQSRSGETKKFCVAIGGRSPRTNRLGVTFWMAHIRSGVWNWCIAAG